MAYDSNDQLRWAAGSGLRKPPTSERPRIKCGDFVRFANLPKTCTPTPLEVVRVLDNGTLRLKHHDGYYAASLFVVVDPPKEVA